MVGYLLAEVCNPKVIYKGVGYTVRDRFMYFYDDDGSILE